MHLFWKTCRWAAISLVGLAAILIVYRGILLLDRNYEFGILSSCEFLVFAFTCRGGADARVLEISLNLPFLIVVYAPIMLVGVITSLLNTGTIDN